MILQWHTSIMKSGMGYNNGVSQWHTIEKSHWHMSMIYNKYNGIYEWHISMFQNVYSEWYMSMTYSKCNDISQWYIQSQWYTSMTHTCKNWQWHTSMRYKNNVSMIYNWFLNEI